MGLMSNHLEEKIAEFAYRIGATEREVYENKFYYGLAVLYAYRELQKALNKVHLALKSMEKEAKCEG